MQVRLVALRAWGNGELWGQACRKMRPVSCAILLTESCCRLREIQPRVRDLLDGELLPPSQSPRVRLPHSHPSPPTPLPYLCAAVSVVSRRRECCRHPCHAQLLGHSRLDLGWISARPRPCRASCSGKARTSSMVCSSAVSRADSLTDCAKAKETAIFSTGSALRSTTTLLSIFVRRAPGCASPLSAAIRATVVVLSLVASESAPA